MNPAPTLKGRTELVEDVARISTAYLPVEDGDPLGPARGIMNGLLISAMIIAVPILVWLAL